MDTQTLFTVLGSVAAVIAVAIYILSLMTKSAVLESERRVMKEIDEKFDRFEATIAKYVDDRLDDFENRFLSVWRILSWKFWSLLVRKNNFSH